MPDSSLEALRETLLAIPAEKVRTPEVAMTIVLEEAEELSRLFAEPRVWAKMLDIGTREGEREALARAIAAARAAQTEWVHVRERTKSAAQRAREEAGHRLRHDMLTAGRFNLRWDRGAVTMLADISEGEGVADLVQDLYDLSNLFEQKRAAFAADKTFDLDAQVVKAKDLAEEIADGLSRERHAGEQASAVAMRDRAYTHLESLSGPLRDAGRYAFRDDEELRRRFARRRSQLLRPVVR